MKIDHEEHTLDSETYPKFTLGGKLDYWAV